MVWGAGALGLGALLRMPAAGDGAWYAAVAALIALVLLATGLLLRQRHRLRTVLAPAADQVLAGLRELGALVSRLDGGAPPDTETRLRAAFDALHRRLEATLDQQRQASERLERRIDDILHVVQQVQRGDLGARIADLEGDQAIDRLAVGVQGMLDNLNRLVARVQEAGVQVASSATQIAATAAHQEAAVSEQAAGTHQIMASVSEISATSSELVETMEQVRAVVEAAAASATDGQQALATMEATMRQMREATDAITAKLAVLSEKAGNIGAVVVTINKVADQTNLLSLNAAIEAEKAGEAGKGFAVVADEIRRLADQTGAATWDIEQMVKEMQSAVSAGVMGMDKFTEQVGRAAGDVAAVSARLGQTIDQVRTLAPRFESVNEGMQAQAEAAAQIRQSMVQLDQGSQQTAESLRQSKATIEHLKHAAHELQDSVARLRAS